MSFKLISSQANDDHNIKNISYLKVITNTKTSILKNTTTLRTESSSARHRSALRSRYWNQNSARTSLVVATVYSQLSKVNYFKIHVLHRVGSFT